MMESRCWTGTPGDTVCWSAAQDGAERFVSPNPYDHRRKEIEGDGSDPRGRIHATMGRAVDRPTAETLQVRNFIETSEKKLPCLVHARISHRILLGSSPSGSRLSMSSIRGKLKGVLGEIARTGRDFMRIAYMLIKVDVGKVDSVASSLIEIEEVTEVYSVSGSYDILAKVLVDDYDQFGDVIPKKIHTISFIRETNTLLAYAAFT